MDTSSITQAYWVMARNRGTLRQERLAPTSTPGHSHVRALFSGVSPGTERLVGRGEVPRDCWNTMACRYMAGSFGLPIKYGYSLVGQGLDGALAGRTVFVMHPHQQLIRIADDDALVLPDDISPRRATLIPNTETALNAIWDAELTSDQTAIIVGGGPVGLLLAFVLQSLDLGPAHVVETDATRRALIEGLSFVDVVDSPDALARGHYDVAFHCSGHGDGLRVALNAVGFEGCVIELSWYGNRPVQVDLGSHFHYQRKRIIASQVAHIARPRRGSTSHGDRMREVLRLLCDSACEQLIGDAVPFAEMPELMAAVYSNTLEYPCPLVRYE